MLVIQFADETPVRHGHIRCFRVVRRYSLNVASSIRQPFVFDRAIEEPIRESYHGDVLNRIRLLANRGSVVFGERLTRPFFAVLVRVDSSRQVERIDVVGAVFVDQPIRLDRKPVRIEAMAITVATPMTIPSTVNALLNLCARMLSTASPRTSL
jgi:hypothetical protein